MPNILNKTTHGIPEGSIYCGRVQGKPIQESFGNPFGHKGGNIILYRTNSRENAVQYFAHMMGPNGLGFIDRLNCTEEVRVTLRLQRQWILENLWQLKGLDLVCWCAPLKCHCEVLMRLANSPNTQEVKTEVKEPQKTASDYHIVCFTGHRPQNMDVQQIKNARDGIRNVLTQLKAEHGDRLLVISGCAAGVDQFAAHIALELGIRWTAAIPHEDYPKIFKLEGPEFSALLKTAHKVIYVHPKEKNPAFKIWMNFSRNKWMVEKSNQTIAVTYLDPNGITLTGPTKGGTMHGIQCAKRKANTDINHILTIVKI
jgi:uncharacterized phage-like protein YoqJ